MFYSQIILAKKGPLGKVWQAAHWGDKKLNRPAIFSTDISDTVSHITSPSVPMALRVSGHLLLGVVRIYSRKVKYLMEDCQRVTVKVKMAYTSHANKDNTNNNIDLLDTSGNHSTLNVSKNIAQLELEQVEFEIPFDIHAETDALDWVPAAELLDTTTINNNNDNSFAAVDDRPQQNEEEEEQWDVFEPFDEQQEEEGRATDESTVSDMEVARAAPKESMQSEPSLRTSEQPQNASGDNLIREEGSDPEFPLDDDMMPMDDDNVPLDDGSDTNQNNNKIRLSNDDAAAPGISFGDDSMQQDTPASKTNNKRAKKQKSKTTKRRKIRDEYTVVSSDEIRANLADASDLVLPYEPPQAVYQTNEQLLDQHLPTLEKMARPSLADKGDLAPELITLWESHNGVLFGKAWPYALDEEEEEEPEAARGAAAEQEPKDEQQPLEDDEAIPFDEDDQVPPMDDDFPLEDDQVPALDDSPRGGDDPNLSDTNSVFSLGATNGLDENEVDDNMTSTSKWHKNTVKVLNIVKNSLDRQDAVTLQGDLFHHKVSRRTAAGAFFEILQLKTLNFIELHQDESYGEIVISEGPRFNEPPPE